MISSIFTHGIRMKGRSKGCRAEFKHEPVHDNSDTSEMAAPQFALCCESNRRCERTGCDPTHQ